MTITKKYCDHCGKEIDPRKDYDDLDVEFMSVRVDLCKDCYSRFKDFVCSFFPAYGDKTKD